MDSVSVGDSHLSYSVDTVAAAQAAAVHYLLRLLVC